MKIFIISVVTILIIVSILGTFHQSNIRNMIKAVFKDRPKLTDEEFYMQYFKNLDVRKEVPIKVRSLFTELLDTDFSQLSSNDSFEKELQFIFEIDSWADTELIAAIEDEFDIEFSEGETAKLFTIKDVVLSIEQELRKKEVEAHHYR